LSRGAGVYIKYADRDILQGNLDSAYTNLQIALSLDANDTKADSVRRAYLTAREDRIIRANLVSNESSDLETMQINLRLEEANTNHSRFQSDNTNHVAATKAMENYRQILHIQSSHPAAREGLDTLCDELISASQNAFDQGNTGDAFWFYKNALEINPNDPRLAQLETQLN
jgi:Flp pilus assembly protein TadD